MNGTSRQVSRLQSAGPTLHNLRCHFLVMMLLAVMISYSSLSQAEASNTWTVSVPVANVRAAPAGNAELVEQLPAGQQVTELDRQGAWIQVRLQDESLAWMHQVTLTQSVELFGLALDQADRSALRSAISEAGVKVVREMDTYPYDLYDPSPWWTGATEMAMGYTLEDQLFAVAEITFRSFNDTEQVRQIAEQVRDQLGPWQRVVGRRAEGPVEFEWRRGGVQVMVHRGWPDTTTYLTYEIPDRIEQMQQALQNR